jgi:hypothetical protein
MMFWHTHRRYELGHRSILRYGVYSIVEAMDLLRLVHPQTPILKHGESLSCRLRQLLAYDHIGKRISERFGEAFVDTTLSHLKYILLG